MKPICHNTIRGRIGDAFSDVEIDDALERITNRYKRKKANRGDGPAPSHEQLIREALGEVGGEVLEQTVIDKRLELMALRAKARRKDHFDALPDDWTASQKLKALNVGSEFLGAGTGLSVDARRRAIHVNWLGEVERGLRQLGTLDRLANPLRRRDKVFEGDVAKELSILNGGKGKATGNQGAADTARILKKVQDDAVAKQNAEGAWISRLDGYVTRQSHDSIKVSGGFWKGMKAENRAAAQADWINEIKPRLSDDTFDGVDDIDGFLRTVWTDIVSGHLNVSEGVRNDLDAVKPNGLLAGKASEERVLHFKSPEDWLAYNERFGEGTFFETFMAGLDRAAGNTALMSVWGPNPRAAFDNARSDLIGEARKAGDIKTAKSLNSFMRDSEFNELDGRNSAPASPRLATIGRGLRLQQGLAKLGGMTLSSISDTSLAAHTLRKAGVPLLQSYNSVFSGIGRMQSKGKKEAANLINVGSRQIMSNMVSRFAATDGAYGIMGKMQSQFYTLNLFQMWGSGVRAGVGSMLSANLGNKSKIGFKALDKDTADQLTRYNIDSDIWDMVRKQARKIDGDDENIFLTMDALSTVPDGQLAKWGKGKGFPTAKQARDEVAVRLQAYFGDLTDTAMTEPRAREQAKLTQGLQAGTPAGEAMRVFMQFKSFPTAIITRHALPTAKGAGGIKPLAGIAHIVVAGTILGYIARQSKNLAKGLTLEPLADDEGVPNMNLLTASLLQGGGLGIFGDLLLADYNRFGSGPIATLGGPVVGEFEGALRIFGGLRDGDDVASQALRQTMGNIPFANLFYTKAAYDYMIGYQMQEWVNPGSLKRYEDRIAEERGQTFLLPPSTVVG